MTLFELFGLLRRHWVLVVTLPVVTAAVVFGVAWFLPDEYTASISMYVLSQESSDESATLTQQDLSMGQMITNDVATLIKSERVQRNVADQLGLRSISGYKFNLTTATNTRVITLSVTGTDPSTAANVANATVENVSQIASEVMEVQSVNVIDSASVPTSPSGPRRMLFTAVGALAGFFLAVVVVVLRDMLDTRVRGGDEAEQILGVPVVGHFPILDE